MAKPFDPTRHKLTFGGFLALAIFMGGWWAWVGFKQGPRAAWAVCFVAVATAFAAYGLVGLWMGPLLDDRSVSLRELVLAPKRMKRMLDLLEFLPEETPTGWRGPINPKPTDGCWVSFSSGAAIIAYFTEELHGRYLHVTLASKDTSSISDERAADILTHFRDVGPFMEMDFTPNVIADHFPHVRTWVALPYETIKKLPIPARPPAILDRPLNAHLRAVRKHLPTKLPEGWSVPLAVTQFADEEADHGAGAWLVDDDDATFLVQLVGSQDRAKLCVIVWHPGGETVSEPRAYSILAHFRGISAFVQCEDDGSIAGARTYLGEIETTVLQSLLS